MNSDNAQLGAWPSRHARRLLIGALVAALLVLANNWFTVVWFSGPVVGRVISAAGGGPVPDASVAVSWLVQGLEGASVRYLHLDDTVTNANGYFRIDGWGPRISFGDVRNTQPEIRVLADGYMPLRAHRLSDADAGIGGSPASSPERKRVLRIKPIESDEEYERALLTFVGEFHFVVAGRHCEWRLVPNTIVRIARAKARLAAKHLGIGLQAIHQLGRQEACGNAEEFFGKLRT